MDVRSELGILGKVTTLEEGEVTIIQVRGKISIGSGDIALRNAVAKAMENGRRKILLDLNETTSADSSGIGELISAYSSATSCGVDLRMCALPDKIADILTVTKLITVFYVYDNREDALAAFAEGT